MKQFMTDDGPVDVATVDGYNFGDRLLEGVMFHFRINVDKIVCIGVDPSSKKYFEDLNQQKWLDAAHAYAQDNDIFGVPGERKDAWVVEVSEEGRLICDRCRGDFTDDETGFYADYGCCIDCTDSGYLADFRGDTLKDFCKHIIEQNTPWKEKAEELLEKLK